MPVWHASVAVAGPGGGLLPLVGSRRDLALREARRLLAGVGIAPARVDVGQLVAHVRQALSPAELAELPASWLALPAIDRAGEGNHLRRIR